MAYLIFANFLVSSRALFVIRLLLFAAVVLLKNRISVDFLSNRNPFRMMTIAEIQKEITLLSQTDFGLEAVPGRQQLPFNIQHNILAPMAVSVLNTDYHTIDINIGRPFHLFCKVRTNKNSGVCEHGNIAALLSPGEQAELNWTPEFNSLRISLSTGFVDRVVGEANVKFQTVLNSNDILLFDLCTKLREQKWLNENMQSAYAESIAIAMVIHLHCNYSARGKKSFAPKGRLSASQLKKVFDYTAQHIGKNIRLSALAAEVHMSEFHFARLFKLTLGISPYRFVLQMKIDQAKKLIKNERKSCSDIAYILNFSDQAHFSHVFKKFTGLSPRTFMNAVA